jgi:hypothetical protein
MPPIVGALATVRLPAVVAGVAWEVRLCALLGPELVTVMPVKPMLTSSELVGTRPTSQLLGRPNRRGSRPSRRSPSTAAALPVAPIRDEATVRSGHRAGISPARTSAEASNRSSQSDRCTGGCALPSRTASLG